MPNLILYNGKVVTLDHRVPHATALATDGRRILAVGHDSEIRELTRPGTRSINLEGNILLPGFTDAHFHYSSWALSLHRISLSEITSLSEMCDRLLHEVSQKPADHWILGYGWNEHSWSTPRLPTRVDLDDITPAHPVILWRSDLHLAVINSLALQKAGITRDTPDPPAGIIDRDSSGMPTGVLRDLAINLVADVVPPPSEDEILEAMRTGFPLLHRLGITGIHDFRVMGGAEATLAFRSFQRLQAAGELPLRVWMQIPSEHLNKAVSLGIRTGFGDELLRVGHAKFFSDGSQGARTAWMLEPYEDTNDSGIPLTPIKEIIEAMHHADQFGIAIAVHAIGDRAIRELLAGFSQVLNQRRESTSCIPSAPHRIEHVQNIRPEDVIKMGELPVVGSVQPIHIVDDYPMIEHSVGSRAQYAYPFRDLLNAGTVLAFGSDCPVADPNPLLGIHAAVTRQRSDGTPPGGWYPDQRLTVREAVLGYSLGPAVASGQETMSGSITPGKFADLVVLDRDIFTVEAREIADTQVVMTVLDGKIVFER